MTTATEKKEWLTTAEAAEIMQVSTQTLHNWRSAKNPIRPRGYKFGKAVKYRPATIEAWVEAQREE